jgi:hypothetical protein
MQYLHCQTYPLLSLLGFKADTLLTSSEYKAWVRFTSDYLGILRQPKYVNIFQVYKPMPARETGLSRDVLDRAHSHYIGKVYIYHNLFKSMVEKIPLEKYKWHKGHGQQYKYKGVALTMAEQIALIKINEIIDIITPDLEKEFDDWHINSEKSKKKKNED